MFDEYLPILLFQSNNPKYSNVKRILDILVASIMLVVILPLFLCMFLCVIVALKLPNLKYIWPKEEEKVSRSRFHAVCLGTSKNIPLAARRTEAL